jgi:hypothetical protein
MVLLGIQVYSQNHYTVRRLPFNTMAKELAPAFYQDGLVFCSDRKQDFLMSYTDLENNPLTNLYQAEQKKPGKFENPRLLSKELTTFLFEGPSTFSKDGKTIYFTRTIDVSVSLRNRNRQDTTFGIFSAELSGGAWTNLTQFRFNRPDYNTGYPCLSDDGTLLFFCSDAPGGFGGFDIYVSKLENGRWGQPKNLGAGVNTPKNEVFPFIHGSGRLYFASRGHNQRGDLDLYFTVAINGEWQKPQPMTEPFNSKSDDYGLIMNAASDTGYFVSNRSGSADIFSAWSNLPTFLHCPDQQENDYCFVFYEPNNNEVDTTTFAYEWDLGDGTVIRALEAEHCFAKPGSYLVQLNIVDKLSREVLLSQASHTFIVEKIEQAYIQSPETVSVGEEINFNGNESYLKDFTIDNYYWDYGDGYRTVGTASAHRFVYPGTYNVILGVTDKNDNPDEPVRRSCVTRKIVVVKPVE